MSSTVNTRLNRALAIVGVALIVATGAALAIHSGRSGAAATPAVSAAAVDHVQIKDFVFGPSAIAVSVGTTITWTNGDSAPHTATSGTSRTSDGMFDTGILDKGASKTVKLSRRGTIAYYCSLHPFMQGTVTVK